LERIKKASTAPKKEKRIPGAEKEEKPKKKPASKKVEKKDEDVKAEFKCKVCNQISRSKEGLKKHIENSKHQVSNKPVGDSKKAGEGKKGVSKTPKNTTSKDDSRPADKSNNNKRAGFSKPRRNDSRIPKSDDSDNKETGEKSQKRGANKSPSPDKRTVKIGKKDFEVAYLYKRLQEIKTPFIYVGGLSFARAYLSQRLADKSTKVLTSKFSAPSRKGGAAEDKQ